MSETHPLLEQHFRFHDLCSTVECPDRFRSAHDAAILQIHEHIVVESFDDVLCDSFADLLQRANNALEPRKLETSCELNDFVGVSSCPMTV